jgi:hypothetical protein
MFRSGKLEFPRFGPEQVFKADGDGLSRFDLAADHPVMSVRISQERRRPFV